MKLKNLCIIIFSIILSLVLCSCIDEKNSENDSSNEKVYNIYDFIDILENNGINSIYDNIDGFKKSLKNCSEKDIVNILYNEKYSVSTKHVIVELSENINNGLGIVERDLFEKTLLDKTIDNSIRIAILNELEFDNDNNEVLEKLILEENSTITTNALRTLERVKAENKTLIPIPEEAEIVIRIFREYIGGKGIGKIVADLNKDSVPGKPWAKERVRYILTNEKYCGDSLYQKYYTPHVLPLRNIPNRGEVPKYYVEGTHAAIIDKETFHTVKQMFDRNMLIYGKRQKREIENFAGRLICGDCGRVYKKRIVGSEPTWICSKNGVAGQRCKTHPLSEGALKKSFVFMYNRLQQHRELIIKDAYQKLLELRKAFFNSNSAVLDIDTELAELAEQNAMYVRFHSQKIIDEITFIEQTGEIKQRINELRSRRIKLMNDNEEERCIELLREAIQELEELPQSILLFDFNIFDKLVNKVAVMPDSLVFELRCGIKLREEIIWN